VVKTDANGRYTVPIEDSATIFVIKPTGYAVPVNEQMLPRFCYIHQPNGSPPELNLRCGRPNTISLSGHTHRTEHHYFRVNGGFEGSTPHHHYVMTAVSGS
jgi:hypothetical protein